MSKKYGEDSTLIGEEFSKPVAIHDWLAGLVGIKEEPQWVYKLFQRGGKYYHNTLKSPPEGIIQPNVVEVNQCHYNNVCYADLLADKQSEVLNDFKFVTGYYSAKAIIPEVPENKRYRIGRHSFMLYKGSILDYTTLRYPPMAFAVDQYFGVAFEVKILLGAIEKLDPEHPPVPIIEILRNEPYIK